MRCLSLTHPGRYGALILAVVPLLLTGCLPEPCIDTTLTALQTEVFTPTCATSSCHGGAAPSRGLDMNAGATLASSVDVEAVEPGWVRVVPGDTAASLLYKVLLDSVGNTRRMPPGFSLDACEAAAVRVWIEEGAQDD
jgi:hypothetical protein